MITVDRPSGPGVHEGATFTEAGLVTVVDGLPCDVQEVRQVYFRPDGTPTTQLRAKAFLKVRDWRDGLGEGVQLQDRAILTYGTGRVREGAIREIHEMDRAFVVDYAQ